MLDERTMRSAFTAILLCGGLAGCTKACGHDHPYVPYAVGEGGAAVDAALAVSDLVIDAGLSFAEQPGVIAPPNLSQWSLEGVTLVAPQERMFVIGLVRDFDGDGVKDALALVRSTAGGEAAQIVVYKGNQGGLGPARSVDTHGAPVNADPTCSPSQRLGLVGKRSALVELGFGCAGHGAKDPSRWLGIISLDGPAPHVRFSTIILDPPGAPTLSIEADGSDRDGDGLDDVTLRVSLEGGQAPFEPAPKASAVVRWFDRSAGMSRDPDEPDASLRALASIAAARAARPKDAPLVPLYVRQLRALYGAICAEGGSPRITRALGNGPISCGASSALEEAAVAEVRAYASMGDVIRAASALDVARRLHTSKNPRVPDPQTWITQAAPVSSSAALRAVSAIPQIDRGRQPSWGALAFDASGKLLVRTLAGVVRVDPQLGDENEADVSTWKTQVIGPDGAMRFIEAYSACDGLALHATFAPTGDADPRDVALPIVPAFSARCTSAKGEAARAIPLAWGPSGLEVIVAGEPVLIAPDLSRATALATFLDQAGQPGSPRSPSGKSVAFPTSIGIVVRGAKTRILRAKELDGGYGELRDCTVSDDALRVACIRGGRAFVGVWDP